MNERNIRSQGYVPFSWKEKPGIPKFINHHNLKMMSEKNEGGSDVRSVAPPPAKCYMKGLRRWQDDPFLAALKSCTKGDNHYHVLKEKNLSKSSLFSCKHSCNVENHNLVNFSKLPPIPRERYYARSFVRNSN